MTTMRAEDYYTDEKLREDMISGAPGPKNSAPHFLKLDTVERRLRASGEAHTLTNLLGFRRSEAVEHAVTALLQNIARGEEDKELYGEKRAREDREKDKALREQRAHHDKIAWENLQKRLGKK